MRLRVLTSVAIALVVIGGCSASPAPGPDTVPTETSTTPSTAITTPPAIPTSTTATPTTPTPATTAPSRGAAPVPSPSSRTTPAPATPPAPSRTATPTPSATHSILTGRVVTKVPTTAKVIALTFDGGSGAQGAEAVAATLVREHVPATFFLTGAFAAANPSLSGRLAQLGSVGNHTQTHPHLTGLSDGDVRAQVTSAHTAILVATGRDPHPLFRFPYGESDTRTLRLVNDLGYVAVGWTVDTLGWKGRSEGVSVEQVSSRTAAARTPGEIVLMHLGAAPDGSTLDADALPRVIDEARAAGYAFVTLDAL